MRYVLGSETELLSFTEHGAKIEPVGLTHAVDPSAPQNSAGGLLAYALCGTAVRAWPHQQFDGRDTKRAHGRCVELCQSEGCGCFDLSPEADAPGATKSG